MSLEQCNRCLYRDRLDVAAGGRKFCPVAEAAVPDGDDCRDFEHEETLDGYGDEDPREF